MKRLTPRMPREWIPGHLGIVIPVLNLADETGAVEGVLHRVLEKLVGEPVEVQVMKGGTWAARAASAHACLPGANWTALHPTRLDAIVAALLAHVAYFDNAVNDSARCDFGDTFNHSCGQADCEKC